MEQGRAQATTFDHQLFYDAFKASPIGIALEDLEGRPLFVNPALCSMLGFSEKEMLGRHCVEFSPAEDAEKDWALFQQLRAGVIDHYQLDKRFFRRDGSLLWGRLSISLLNDRASPLVVAMVEDISEKRAAEDELQRSEAIIESSDDAIISTNLQGVITSWNGAAQRMFGYAKEDVLGRPRALIIPPELRDQENHIEARVAAGERIEHYETVRVSKDGTKIDVSITVSPVRDTAGTIIGASKIARDITERKRAEEELRRSEARLAAEVSAFAKLDNWSSRLWRIKDLREGLDEMLRAVIELLGADKGNVQLFDGERDVLTIVAQSGFDKPFLDLYGQASITDQTACGRALRLRDRVIVEDTETDSRAASSRLRARASGYRAVVSVPLMSAEGSPQGVLNTHFRSAHRPSEESLRRLDLYTRQVAGLIQRCEAERALEESEQRFRLVANTAPVMIWMADVDKQCTYFNEPWLEFTGRPLESELGDGWARGVHPDDLKGCLDTYRESFDQRKPFRMEYRLRRHDGEHRWVLDIGVPRFSADGSFAGYIGSGIDVTERKLAEDALASLSGRLIEAEEEERKRIAREIHDDYQQRLALVADDLELLARDCPVDLGLSLRDLWGRVSELGGDLHSLSHRLHSSTLERLGLIAGLKSFCKEFSDQQGIQIDFVHKNVPPEIPADTALCLFRVVQEAVRNVKKHSSAQRAEVRLESENEEIRLSISDGGKGFNPGVGSAQSGIGIRSMQERLRLLGGKIRIESQPTKGTRIDASLPFKAVRQPASRVELRN